MNAFEQARVDELATQFAVISRNHATAGIYAERCAGIELNEARVKSDIDARTNALIAQGYLPFELRDAVNQLDPQEQASIVLSDFERNGLRPRATDATSRASFCNAAQRERAQNTDIGRYLS